MLRNRIESKGGSVVVEPAPVLSGTVLQTKTTDGRFFPSDATSSISNQKVEPASLLSGKICQATTTYSDFGSSEAI